MTGKSLTMMAVGDLILEEQQGEHFLSLAAPVLKSGDVVVGQGEFVFTSRGVSTFAEMFSPAPACPPGNMGALASAGFNVITLAGNHVWDMGTPGIQDTISGLRNYGIAVCGAGMNIGEARRPAIIQCDGTRFGFLSYNCVGPIGTWATQTKPGCAYVHIIAHYEMTGANPGGPPDVYTFAEPRSLKAMADDIQKLRPFCDILVVSFHKGITGPLISPDIAMYDQQVSYAAIDAGADLILGHHAHMLKGIEQYKGKVIFHGLGHFIRAISLPTERQRKAQSFFNPYSSISAPKLSGGYNFQTDAARYRTIIAKCVIDDKNISSVRYLPCLINEQRQPEVLQNDERGQQIFDFMDTLTREAGLNTRFDWEGDEVLILTDQI